MFINNRAMRNARDGFRIRRTFGGADPSNSNTFLRNRIVRNDGDGIDIDDSGIDGTVIDGNRITNNRGTGIEDDADDGETAIKNNVVKGNRTDIAGKGDDLIGLSPNVCDNGSATDGGSNVFVTGGFDVCTPGTGDEQTSNP